MRTLGTGHAAATKRVVTAPRTLVKLTRDPDGTPTVFYFTGGPDITYDGQTWVHRPMQDIDITIIQNQQMRTKISFGADDSIMVPILLSDDKIEVEVYETDQSAGSAASEASGVFFGVATSVNQNASLVSPTCETPNHVVPDSYINDESGYVDLAPAGTYRTPVGTIILSRDDGR